MVGASHVSLLIANFSGSAVVRLSHVTLEGGLRDGHNERVESLDDATYSSILSSQRVEVVREGDGWLVLVPVTERGDAIGILELSLPREPDGETVGNPLLPLTPWRTP